MNQYRIKLLPNAKPYFRERWEGKIVRGIHGGWSAVTWMNWGTWVTSDGRTKEVFFWEELEELEPFEGDETSAPLEVDGENIQLEAV